MVLLKDHDDIMAVSSNKDIGTCLIRRHDYIAHGFGKHLSDSSTYQPISKEQSAQLQNSIHYQLREWLRRFDCDLPDNEKVYLKWALQKYLNKIARFRMTAKVHKAPWHTLPLVCCAGTFMNYWSKWIDT